MEHTAYAASLFLAVGLAVTMGLMNFVNLAHGSFAMAGGYARQIEDTVRIHTTTIRLAKALLGG